MSSLAALQERFALPDALRFESGTEGLTRAVFTTPHAQAHLYLHGAHLTHYQPAGQAPVLFLSKCSEFAADKAIRGGVPLIFPWFGAKADDKAAPSHGFARLGDWDVSATTLHDDGSVTLELRLAPDQAALQLWPASWALSYRVTVGATLHLELSVHNTGETAFRFENALHTYFRVGDVQRASIEGLGGTSYLDKTDGMRQKRQDTDPLRITAETDRVYLDTRTPCTIDDPDLKRHITVEKRGSDATVVWNPAQDKAAKMADLCDDEWPRFLCVESGNIGPHAVTLAPGATHAMSVTISSSQK